MQMLQVLMVYISLVLKCISDFRHLMLFSWFIGVRSIQNLLSVLYVFCWVAISCLRLSQCSNSYQGICFKGYLIFFIILQQSRFGNPIDLHSTTMFGAITLPCRIVISQMANLIKNALMGFQSVLRLISFCIIYHIQINVLSDFTFPT